MPLSVHLLLAVTALCCFATVIALPMDSFVTNYQCQCLNTIDTQLNSQRFQKIEILPPRAHCHNTEVLITMKNKKTLCVNPDADWVQLLIQKVMKSRNAAKN